MIVLFSEGEFTNLVFEPVPRRALPPAYLDERERIWQVELEKCLARSDNMWNGEIYTIEDILAPGNNRLQIKVSTCEYKDVVTRQVRGSQALIDEYGPGVIMRFAGVSFIPRTSDGKYVFGMRADNAMGGSHPVGIIAGMLNKDEKIVEDFASLQGFALKEATEETLLQVDPQQTRFVALCYDWWLYSFLFTTDLTVHSSDVGSLNRPGEFSRLVAFSRDEALAVDGPMTWGFRFWRDYLNLISPR